MRVVVGGHVAAGRVGDLRQPVEGIEGLLRHAIQRIGDGEYIPFGVVGVTGGLIGAADRLGQAAERVEHAGALELLRVARIEHGNLSAVSQRIERVGDAVA